MNTLVATPAVVPMLFGIKWLDPEWLQHEYGAAFIWISLAIVFVECGLFFPFLPGDTLLFALGLFIAGSNSTGYTVIGISNEPAQLVIAMSLLIVAAFAGNVAGYEIGRKIGPPLYERDGRILKKQYFDKTGAFFDKHGNKALVIGRFVPFVRTYVTVVAGVTLMERRRFVIWSAVGAVLWVVSITLLGYFLGEAVPALGENIDYVTIAILAFSAIPLVWEWWRHRRTSAKEADDNDGDGHPDRDIIGMDATPSD
ncbi:DedA family protein [Nocardioides bizhenqiangii]|uniref:VTT domain-containing protein n=1 Tax=Nocardioides bizhenqiangii TaxID=3095076 RepID=A0ABZ0ZPD2_9ACTN|nr:MULTISPECIES: VTT domain-containing protein [unclassified Nocardioides]MDZ5619903.1 VTT domain-containing protein [Nocardioides sp. HM23]WQQ26092.1 VTT domain-containing protein [Nocardioides sp. HM61]